MVLSLTLGLAPFVPMPHLLEKLQMLLHGSLNKAIDLFDLLLHAAPLILLLLRLVALRQAKRAQSG